MAEYGPGFDLTGLDPSYQDYWSGYGGYDPYAAEYSPYDLGGADPNLLYDTTTGNWVTWEQAFQIDSAAAMQALGDSGATNPLPGLQGGTSPQDLWHELEQLKSQAAGNLGYQGGANQPYDSIVDAQTALFPSTGGALPTGDASDVGLSGAGGGGATPPPPQVPPKEGLSPLALGALLGVPGALGLAGVIQSLTSGGKTATTTTRPNAPQPSTEETAALRAALQAAGVDPEAFLGSLGAQGYTGAPLSQGGRLVLDPSGNLIPGSSGAAPGVMGRLTGRVPAEEAAFNTGLANLLSTQGLSAGNLAQILPMLSAGLPQLLAGQEGALAGLPGAAGAALAPSPATGALENQALGMAQGRLPMLADPEVLARINTVFQGKQTAIDRYLDTALQDAIRRAQEMGFAGGMDILREGTPQALLAPSLAEAVRQRGALAGQQAQTELDLAQNLPTQGANLLTALAGLRSTGVSTAANAANAYTNPVMSRLGGATNMLGQTTGGAGTLYNASLQGPSAMTDLIRALTGMTETQRQSRLASAGTTQTTTGGTPNLLDAFTSLGPLIGGLGQGLGAYALLNRQTG